ncbi:MAG: hypothetical protein K6F53_07480 [Lachnospiraceae bacterium]|nr:hypothetical protein [Lachnospiraceae bacterium]
MENGSDFDFQKILDILKTDEHAKDMLIQYYMPKVRDIARLYTGQGVPDEDLIGEGYLSLVSGVSKLASEESSADGADGAEDLEAGLIRDVMDAMEALIREDFDEREKDLKMVEKVNYVAEKAGELFEAMGRKVTVEELAGEGELSEELIREALRLSGSGIEYLEI